MPYPIIKTHRYIPVLILFFLISYNQLQAQCVNTGFKNATSFATDNSIGVYNFSSPANAQHSDNARSAASSVLALLTNDTYYLKATGFNFSIPSQATICGVTVEIQHRASGLLLTASIRDNEVRLIKGGIISGNNYKNGSNWGNSDAYTTYGGTNDKWGLTLTPANVNASSFGVAISAHIVALIAVLPDAEINHIRVSIDYAVNLPVVLEYFKAIKKDNETNLEWKTATEEDNAATYLQRSTDNTTWNNIASYEMRFANTNKIYTYKDRLSRNGTYAYRLKMISRTGEISYSETRIVILNEKELFTLYPNPATDYIVLNAIKDPSSVYITDTYSRQRRITSYQKNGNGSYKFLISEIPKGIYFITVEGQTKQFLKN